VIEGPTRIEVEREKDREHPTVVQYAHDRSSGWVPVMAGLLSPRLAPDRRPIRSVCANGRRPTRTACRVVPLSQVGSDTVPSVDAREVWTVLDALHDAGIPVGVTGGWGVDALLGAQHRHHEDLDLGLSADRVDAAADVLAHLGYNELSDERPARLVLGSLTGQVDLHPIVFDATGAGVQTGVAGEPYDYPSGSLDGAGTIDGRPVRCATPELQVSFHLGYEPSIIDRMDMAALAGAFDLTLPHPYA
jgi:lincosamide nucleotidyltransferase A/C/D/E